MKATLIPLMLPAMCLVTAALPAQQPATPIYTQVLTYIKVEPGKANEYVAFVRETTKKTAQVRANAGEILTWTLLRSMYPVGEEARADYLVSVIAEGPPPAPRDRARLEGDMKKAGVRMTVDEFYAKRNGMSKLVAQEIWRPLARVAAPKVGHYIFVNRMKVLDRVEYPKFEQEIWRPLAEEWVKQGAMSGWIFAVKLLPSGTDTQYAAYSADMFPSWQATFAARPSQPIFEKVHPGKDYEKTMAQIPQLRNLAQRELWVVVDRVEKDPSASRTSATSQE